MDRLKYIKLENEDGSYSSSIPLAVDSNHVDVNGSTLTDELNNKANNSSINNLQSQINGLASGSPLVASSVADMIDTTRVYVNTTDGNWYYYDGDSWEIGGVYQGVVLEDKSVIYSKLSSDLKNSLEENFDITNNYLNNKTDDAYLTGNDGHELSANGYCYYSIPCEYGETYKVIVYLPTTHYATTNNFIYVKNTDSEVIYKRLVSEDTRVNDYIETYVTIPKGGVTLQINTIIVRSIGINKAENYIQKEKISYNQLDENLQNIFKVEEKNITSNMINIVNDYYFTGYSFAQASGYSTKQIDVTPGKRYKIESYEFYQNIILFFANHNSTITTDAGNVSYTLDRYVNFYRHETNGAFTYEFVCPPYCNRIYIAHDNNHPTKVYEYSTYKIDLNSVEVDIQDIELNILSNKEILFNGDSLTYGAGDRNYQTKIAPRNNTGWVARIKNLNPKANVYGYGVGGTHITKNVSRTDSILESTITMHQEHPNADYIIIQGGTNDAWGFSTYPLGTISTGYDAVLDEYTFSGALESLFKYAQTNWLGKKIGFIVNFPVWNNSHMKSYMERAIEICKKWSIPYLNLFEESNLNMMNSTVRFNYSENDVNPDGDGCHPNADGYEIIINRINKWLKSL